MGDFDNYSMKVQAKAVMPSVKDIDAQIRKLEKSISKLKISGKFDDTALKNLTNQLDTLKSTVTTAKFSPDALASLTKQVENALGSVGIGNIKIDNNLKNQAQQTGQQIGKIISDSAEQTINSGSLNTDKLKTDKIQSQWEDNTYEAKVESMIAKTKQWIDEQGEARVRTEELERSLAKLGTAYIKVTSEGGNTIANQQALKQAEAELTSELKRVNNEVTMMNAEYAKSSKIESFHQRLTEFYDKNAAAQKKWGVELKRMMNKTTSGAKVTNDELVKMDSCFKRIKNEAREAGKLGNSFIGSLKEQGAKFLKWVSVTRIIMETIYQIKKMIHEVYELDSAMTNLYKVTDETNKRYDQFLDSATDKAKKLGRTVSSLVEQTANWSKLGYSLDESEKLAEISSIYANVGEVDDATAVSDIVTALKAFNIEASNAISIVDKLNELGKKYCPAI